MRYRGRWLSVILYRLHVIDVVLRVFHIHIIAYL